MWKNKPPFRLCLNKAASDEIIWHCKHYTGRGVMKFFASGKELAAEMGVPVEKFAAVHDQHYNAAKKQEKDPEGGSFPAYPSGKTWTSQVARLVPARSSSTTRFQALSLPRSLSMLLSSLLSSTTAWAVCKSMLIQL